MSDTMKRMWTDREIRAKADESAKIRIEAGQTENAKPIYCHPITITSSTSDIITCLIFNNDATPFTKSTFADWLLALFAKIDDVVRVMASGSFIIGTTTFISSFIGVIAADTIAIYGAKASDGSGAAKTIGSKSDFETYVSNFYDSVNKIN